MDRVNWGRGGVRKIQRSHNEKSVSEGRNDAKGEERKARFGCRKGEKTSRRPASRRNFQLRSGIPFPFYLVGGDGK